LIGLSAAIVLLINAIGAFAAGFSYRVDVNAPEPLLKLLNEQLRIIALKNNADVSLDQLRSLYRRTPQEIEALIATEGYFNPKITSSLENENGWLARFTVDPGPRMQIKSIDIQFAGEITRPSDDNDRLRWRARDTWDLNEGAIFRQANWDNAKRKILQVLLAERFPATRITASEALIDVSTNSADLSVTLDSGPAFYFGELEITGLQRYDEKIIRRLNPIEPGSPYNLDKLQTLQQRLQDTGYFSSAIASVDTDSTTPQHEPVKVTVVERRPRRISFGVGYSTDTKNRISTEYEDINFFKRGWRLKSKIRLETLRQEFSGEIALPRTGGGYDPRLFASHTHENIQGQETRKFNYGGAIGDTHGNIERSLSLQHTYEDQTLEDAPGSIRQAIFTNFSWTQRAVDNMLFPNRGYLINIQLGGAPKVLPKSESFVRSYGRGAYYLPVGSVGTLLMRTELGYVAAKSRDLIPSDFLFRTGGDTSVRGYAYQGIGIQEGSAIVGGRVLGVGSIEYTHWIKPQWGAAIFYDIGNATDRLVDFHPQHGYGVGARWRSPVGPLNLDIAYGQESKEYRLHFTVGIAF